MRQEDIIYFNTDDDFYKYCVNPKLVQVEKINSIGETNAYCDWNFTPGYLEDVKSNKVFIIRDKNSKIIKRNNIVSYRTISKKVQNVKPYYYEKIYKKKLESNS